VTPGSSVTVTVGTGGAAVSPPGGGASVDGNDGSPSSFGSYTANGGNAPTGRIAASGTYVNRGASGGLRDFDGTPNSAGGLCSNTTSGTVNTTTKTNISISYPSLGSECSYPGTGTSSSYTSSSSASGGGGGAGFAFNALTDVTTSSTEFGRGGGGGTARVKASDGSDCSYSGGNAGTAGAVYIRW